MLWQGISFGFLDSCHLLRWFLDFLILQTAGYGEGSPPPASPLGSRQAAAKIELDVMEALDLPHDTDSIRVALQSPALEMFLNN